MQISSFDIFDTCLVRKCGTPENMLDVLSQKAFIHEPQEWARQEFVAARRVADHKLWQENPHYTLQDIWAEFDWSHQYIKPKKELCQLEQELEREMLVPVLSMRDKVKECRKHGDKIIFISDMYLSSDFLIDILRNSGFYQDGDALYVSCECGALKWDGELFEYVRKQENMPSFRHWHHYGDNKQGDYNAPKKLGIKCTLVYHAYTPYQQQWADNDYSLGFKYPSILAGLGRALHYSTEWNTHTDFVLDIIAPFYCSWMYQVLADAQKRGVKRLYFCARDAYQIHKIALAMQPLFPEVGIEYVYMSRKALYNEDNAEAKLAYYKQIGLATTDKVAIVDTTTSGKTLIVLNEFLTAHKCTEVTAYYYLLWNKVDGVDRSKYNVQVFDQYVKDNLPASRFLNHPFIFIFENYFSINKEPKTIDYKDNKPVFITDLMEEDCFFTNGYDWTGLHESLLVEYAKAYVKCGLGVYSRDIFERIALPTMNTFFETPHKVYLSALDSYCFIENGSSKQYFFIKKSTNIIELIRKKRNYAWRRGTIYYSFSNWLLAILKFLKHE